MFGIMVSLIMLGGQYNMPIIIFGADGYNMPVIIARTQPNTLEWISAVQLPPNTVVWQGEVVPNPNVIEWPRNLMHTMKGGETK